LRTVGERVTADRPELRTKLIGIDMTTATWITIALLAPFWWGVALFILASAGDVLPAFWPRVSRLFDWLERTRAESPTDPAISRAAAA
jgi:hypothetical protein